MQKCPKCLAEQNNVNSSACFYCGADMSDSIESDTDESSNDIQEEYIPQQNITLPDSDELGIETNADIMETEAQQLIDTSPLDEVKESNNELAPINEIENSDSIDTPIDSQGIKKLSDNEVKEIEKNLYKNNEFINDREKSDLIEKISVVSTSEPEPFSNSPIEPPKKDDNNKESNKPVKVESDLPKPQKAKKGQGLAYFYNNYIQIQGSQKLHPDDLMTINNRSYILKPKNINKNIALYSAGALLILIVSVFGSFLAGTSNYGDGQVIGIILDDNNNPYIEGATIIFSELGEKSKSDVQGLFSFSNIPSGSHKIEYLINGKITGSDYITIADNSSSHITLKPNIKESTPIVAPIKKLAEAPAKKQPIAKSSKTQTISPAKTIPPSVKKTTTKKITIKQKTVTGYGKLVLAANIDGAKIKVDGNVLGAGNLTYSKIKSGKHSYVVSFDGYKSVSGTFNIKKGETKKISPVLTPLTQAKKEETYKDSDYLYSAKNAFNQADYNTAIADYKKVIDESPNNVKAYFGLAESYSKQKKWELAYDNYIRAAEIHRFKKRTNEAVTCYNKAIKANDKDINAYLGRGDIYLDASEYRAAFGDFDKVVKIDKRNFNGYYGLGEASFKLQRYSKAIKYFKDARSLNSENPLVHQYLTLSYMYEHDRKNTKKCLEKFNQYASEKDKNRFKKDSQYSTVIKYIDSE